MAAVTVPKVLREKRDEALVALLNKATPHERNNLLGILEERFERRVTEAGKRMDRRITKVEARLEQRITEVEVKLKQQIAEVEARFGERMARMRADLIRWMFLFWVGQIGTLVAILWAFLR